jgi:hypothetical protein
VKIEVTLIQNGVVKKVVREIAFMENLIANYYKEDPGTAMTEIIRLMSGEVVTLKSKGATMSAKSTTPP